ncbi:flagellin [Rhodanobacter sp. MP1X3]|jgi:flagellin|uniref:flagellin N-terminal helical domain-containing protein n=1 Tax=Rhodanobacter sp. MP1X3 TaxID=2723086 RepID=UPI0016190F65|nr:flagellin [Rhodanobacter sp. MP1X3]MBB6240877.1 flagellin [Rhodanobacter sp. MP1X3]
MSLVINTNISSLNAQNNLTKSQSALAQATERLSSGLQINSAADNAAGFAIATRFQTQIGGLSTASTNASDAINLAQTAGSALDQVTSNLQAIRDLAVQAANGTYQASDRAAINTEVQQRLSEITRIANQTSFNGTNVLNGQAGSLSFQIGANVGQTINVNLGQGVTTSQVGQISEVSTGNLSGAFVDASGATGAALSLSGLSITGADGTAVTFTGDVQAHSAQDVADAINAAGINGVSAAVNASGGINIYSSGELAVNGAAVTGASANSAAAGFTTFTTAATGYGASGLGTAATGLSATGAAYTDGAALSASGSLTGGDVLTVDDANQLINRVDAALTTVSNFNSTLGAIQNRFQSTIATLSAQSTNLQSSQSSIQDADFAQETANLSKAQVLQQAGISVLATANSQPQNVLKLLQ